MSNQRLRVKITPLAAAVAAALGLAPLAFAQDDEVSSRAIEEVLVTARKRAESALEIPSSIQALSGSDLKEMGARGMADYIRFMPAVTVVDYGAGASTVIFRGATTSAGYVAQSTSSVYLDELAITTTGQQPSVRMVDIARVEALAGPQGTLYGADSQAGTLKIITNKPEMNVAEVIIDASVYSGSDSADSWDQSVIINVPLIDDTLAARFVAFDAKDGGFVDNVYGKTITSDRKSDALYGRSPSGWGTLDNADVVEDDINDHKVSGWRAALRWEINDEWIADLSYLKQKTDSGSYSGFDPNVGDLKAIRYNEESYKTDYNITSLVVEGDLGFAQLVSATSYYKGDVEFDQDITNYHKAYSAYYCIEYAGDAAYYAPYYQPTSGGQGFMYAAGNYCHAPTVEGDYLAAFYETENADRFSQEIRLSNQGDTYDWLIGAFYEDSSYGWVENFGYVTANENGRQTTPGVAGSLYQDSIALAYYEWANGESYPDATETWYSKSVSNAEQTAIFGEVVWHMNESTDITVGARHFDREDITDYYEEHPTGNLDVDPNFANGITRMIGKTKEFVPKVSIKYNLDDDSMIYALWTIGYRPGGTNRQRGDAAFPKQYQADKMINYEAGYKGSFADNTATLSLTAFAMQWDDYQFELIDPSFGPCDDESIDAIPGICGQPYQVGVFNAGDAHINGVNAQFDWNPTDNISLGMNMEWLDAETDTVLELGDAYVEEGTSLPLTPDLTGGIWATYNWTVPSLGADAYARVQWSYSGSRSSGLQYTPFANDDGSLNPFPSWENPSYDIGDLSVGLQGDDWEVSAFLKNITDERVFYGHASQGGYTQQNVEEGRMHVDTVYTNRPREFGVRIIKRFGGS